MTRESPHRPNARPTWTTPNTGRPRRTTRTSSTRATPVYSPFFHVTSRTGINVLHGIHLAIIVLFTLGVCTRVTSVLTWLAALAYIQRNPLALFGQDTMMNLCLFYLMFAPCGATWSVDWLVRRYRAGRAALAGRPCSRRSNRARGRWSRPTSSSG